MAALSGSGLPVQVGHGNFVLVDLGVRREEIVRRLQCYGCLIGATLRLPAHPSWVRVTIGPKREMQRFLSALRAVRQELGFPVRRRAPGASKRAEVS